MSNILYLFRTLFRANGCDVLLCANEISLKECPPDGEHVRAFFNNTAYVFCMDMYHFYVACTLKFLSSGTHIERISEQTAARLNASEGSGFGFLAKGIRLAFADYEFLMNGLRCATHF